MRFSRTAAYAALSIAYLDRVSGPTPVRAREIADHLGIPTDSALKVLQTLVRQGLIHSQLGRHGGYRMVRDASTLSLREVVEAIDGPILATVAVDDPVPAITTGFSLFV